MTMPTSHLRIVDLLLLKTLTSTLIPQVMAMIQKTYLKTKVKVAIATNTLIGLMLAEAMVVMMETTEMITPMTPIPMTPKLN